MQRSQNVTQFVNDTTYRFETKDPNNLYKADVSELKVATATYKAGVSNQEKGDQKVSTKLVNAVLERTYNYADSIEYKIKSAFGKNSLVLLEFFPRGKTFIRKSKRGDVDTILTNFSVKAKKYEKDLGTPFVTDITSIITDWAAAVKAQSGEKTDIKEGAKIATSATDTMAKIINRLFHKVCLNNEGNEADAIAIYFDESPLNRTQASDHDGLGRTFGVVTDEQSGDPLYEVSVRIVDGKSNLLWSGKTDKEGKWRSANVSIGNYTFLFEKAGYATQTLAHEIVDFQDTQLDVKLVK